MVLLQEPGILPMQNLLSRILLTRVTPSMAGNLVRTLIAQFTSSFDLPHRAVILAHYQKSFSLSDRKIKRFHICILFVSFQSLNRSENFR